MKTRTRDRRYKKSRKHKNTRTVNTEGNLPAQFQGINETYILSNTAASQEIVEPQPSTSSCCKEPQPTTSSNKDVDFSIHHNPAASTTVHNSPPPTASKSYKHLENISEVKLLNSDFTKISDNVLTRWSTLDLGVRKSISKQKAVGYKIVDMSLLNNILKSVNCSLCNKRRSRIELLEDPADKNGLAEKLIIYCQSCKQELSFCTSKRVACNGHQNVNYGRKQPFDINVKSVYASQTLMHSGLKRFLGDMDLPAPINATAYNRTLKNISSVSVKLAEQQMKAAAYRLKKIVLDEEPENIELSPAGDMIAQVAVSVDGKWQRRGHCSKIGVVFVISIRTGEVIDYIVKSLFCHTCSKKDKSASEYGQWYEKHKATCQINHSGSSDSMEKAGATEIFLRSIDSRGLKYCTFVGDGDTGTYGIVRDKCKQVYGDEYPVTKEECVGHIQKRMGSALREYKRKKQGIKLADGKSVGGKGRLTDVLVDKMQNYFGEAIRRNNDSLEGMLS